MIPRNRRRLIILRKEGGTFEYVSFWQWVRFILKPAKTHRDYTYNKCAVGVMYQTSSTTWDVTLYDFVIAYNYETWGSNVSPIRHYTLTSAELGLW